MAPAKFSAKYPSAAPLVFLLGAALLVAASPIALAAYPRLPEATKLALIRGMTAEIGIAKVPFPPGKKGLEMTSDGRVLNAAAARQEEVNSGAAERPGQRVKITDIKFGGKEIRLDLNGGPNRTHWYNHLQLGLGGSTSPVGLEHITNGSLVVLKFPTGIPANLTTKQLKQMLSPVIEWNLRQAPVAALGPKLPPMVELAIQKHEVLVGMNTDMVLAAKGHADQKYHQTDPKSGDEYDTWIYGHPPKDTTFVRIEGDRVVRVVDYKADGTTIVRASPEVTLPTTPAPSETASASAAGDTSRPTLRRPGDSDAKPARSESGPGPILIPGAPPSAPLPTTNGQEPQMPAPMGMPEPGTPMPGGPPGVPGGGQPNGGPGE